MKKTFLFALAFIVINSLQAQNVSPQQKISNTATFAKLYGYVRYFHPSDEAATINWEQFLYYGIKEVENAGNSADLTKKLNNLFNPIAPSILIVPSGSGSKFSVQAITPPDAKGMKEVYWQHFGLGAASQELYSSVRVNRLAIKKSRGSAIVSNSFNAKPYKGKKFRLRASIKTNVTQGRAQMWLGIDEGMKKSFFYNMADRPIRKKEWEEYEIIGTVDTVASYITYGFMLVGGGEVWVDNVSIDVEENNKWIKISLKNPSFEASDKEAQDWNTKTSSDNYTIVQGDAVEGKNTLLISDELKEKIQKKIFDAAPGSGDFFTKEVGSGISSIVPLVLYGTESQTYPASDKEKLKSLKNLMRASIRENINATDPYVRLSGVIITWNIFQHFYPYHEEVKTQWEQQLPTALSAAYEAKTGLEYLTVLRRLTEKLKDGHVSVVSWERKGYFTIPATLGLVEGQVIITEVDSSLIAKDKTLLKAGDILMSIDGLQASQKHAEAKSEISGSEQWKTHTALLQLLSGAEDSELTLKIKRGNEEKEVRLLREGYRKVSTPSIRKLNEDTYYINISTTEMKDIKAILPELSKAKGIICDLRGYPKNNHEFISYLLKRDDKNKWMFVPQIIHPDFDKVTYKEMGWGMQAAKPHISGKVIFLTGGGAISYAESYMGFIKNYKLATIVGQPTAGANGNVNSFTLPGNYSTRFTGMKVKQHDGSHLHSLGIQPDVFVSQTIKGITEGRDEYLEKALQLLQKGN